MCTAPLLAANGSSIQSFGDRTVDLKFGSFSVRHAFRVADVSKPLLGSDFFKKNRLLIDVQRGRLVRFRRGRVVLSIPAMSSSSNSTSLANVCKDGGAAAKVADEFPEVLEAVHSDAVPAHGYQHVVPTSGPPLFARPALSWGRSWRLPRKSLTRCNGLVLFGHLVLRGHLPCMWCLRPMVAGGRVGITATSMVSLKMTDILYHGFIPFLL